MTVVKDKVVEDVAFGAHWPCQTMGRGLCAKIRAGSSPRASREPLVASADEPSVEGEKSCSFPHGGPLRLPPPCLALLADRRQWSRCRSRRPSASLATRAHAVVADSNNQPNSNTAAHRTRRRKKCIGLRHRDSGVTPGVGQTAMCKLFIQWQIRKKILRSAIGLNLRTTVNLACVCAVRMWHRARAGARAHRSRCAPRPRPRARRPALSVSCLLLSPHSSMHSSRGDV